MLVPGVILEIEAWRKEEGGAGGFRGERKEGKQRDFYGENLESCGLLLERYFHMYEYYRLVD